MGGSTVGLSPPFSRVTVFLSLAIGLGLFNCESKASILKRKLLMPPPAGGLIGVKDNDGGLGNTFPNDGGAGKVNPNVGA